MTKPEEMGECLGGCGFLMMAATAWKALPDEERPKETHRRYGGQKYCATCYIKGRKNKTIGADPKKQAAQAHRKRAILSDHEVKRLQTLNREWYKNARKNSV